MPRSSPRESRPALRLLAASVLLAACTPGTDPADTGGALALMVAGAGARSRESEPPATGAGVYRAYCASCHGATGTGDGPVAASLTVPPPDLTTIARRRGRFDEEEVLAFIDGRRGVAAHGPREMPVWGAVADETIRREIYSPKTGILQSRLLIDHLRSIQRD